MKLQLYEVEKIPKISGVYFVFAKEKLIYIGVSEYLYGRIGAGRLIKDFLKFGVTSVQYIYIDKKQLFDVERQLIKMFNPTVNKLCKFPPKPRKKKISKYDKNPTWWQTSEVLQ